MILDRLSPHFNLDEFVRTSVAADNTPGVLEVANLVLLCHRVLEPWRTSTGALRVTSGFRSRAVNDALRARGYGASRTSQHLSGEAADVAPTQTTLEHAWQDLVAAVARGLPVDQAIVYVRPRGQGWVHVSYTTERAPRGDLRVQPAGRPGVYVRWIDWRQPIVQG